MVQVGITSGYDDLFWSVISIDGDGEIAVLYNFIQNTENSAILVQAGTGQRLVHGNEIHMTKTTPITAAVSTGGAIIVAGAYTTVSQNHIDLAGCTDVYSSGIYCFGSCNDSKIINNTIINIPDPSSNQSYGIVSKSGSRYRNLYQGNIIKEHASNTNHYIRGIELASDVHARVTGNHCDVGTGILASTCTHSVIEGNTIKFAFTSGYGIRVEAGIETYLWNSIVGNSIEGPDTSTSDGIQNNGAAMVTVQGNAIGKCGGGIELSGSCSLCNITGNVMEGINNTTGTGILINDDYQTVSGNLIATFNNGVDCNSKDIALVGNRIYDCTTTIANAGTAAGGGSWPAAWPGAGRHPTYMNHVG